MEEIFEELKVKFLDALQAALKAFKDTLWGYLKEDVILSARKSLGIIKNYLESTDGKNKKEEIVELIMAKINLPVILKPFKGFIKNIVRDKIDGVIKEILNKGENLLA